MSANGQKRTVLDGVELAQQGDQVDEDDLEVTNGYRRLLRSTAFSHRRTGTATAVLAHPPWAAGALVIVRGRCRPRLLV